jgi:hypothetical protein
VQPNRRDPGRRRGRPHRGPAHHRPLAEVPRAAATAPFTRAHAQAVAVTDEHRWGRRRRLHRGGGQLLQGVCQAALATSTSGDVFFFAAASGLSDADSWVGCGTRDTD